MRTNIKATGMELTEAIKSYVEKRLHKVEKLLALAEDDVVRVEIGKMTAHHEKGDVFRAEITIQTGGHMYRAVSEKDDLYAAIDDARDELIREIKSKKGKGEALFRKGARRLKNVLRFGRGE